jgi:type I restriction enzyme S subunit
LDDFVDCYKTENRKDDFNPRWKRFTKTEIEKRDKTSLDIIWFRAADDTPNYTLPEILDLMRKNGNVVVKASTNLYSILSDNPNEVINIEEYGGISLALLVKLAKQKILAELLNNDEWKTVRLGDVLDTIASKPYQILQSEILDKGEIPVISQSANYIEGYSNILEKTLKIKKPIVIFGDHTRNVKFIDFDFIVGADGVKILVPKDTVTPKFFYYSVLFTSENIENRGYSRHFQYLNKFDISIPPLAIQNAVVEQIERFFAEIEKIERAIKN